MQKKGYASCDFGTHMGCKPNCNKLCPPNSQVNITTCQCICNDGYNPKIANPINGCTPNCNKSCPYFSTLNRTSCTCVCNSDYQLDMNLNICIPTCRISCPINSVLDTKKCQCVCNLGSKMLKFYLIFVIRYFDQIYFPFKGFIKTKDEYCIPNCNKTCPLYSMLDENSCLCICSDVIIG